MPDAAGTDWFAQLEASLAPLMPGPTIVWLEKHDGSARSRLKHTIRFDRKVFFNAGFAWKMSTWETWHQDRDSVRHPA